MTIIEELKMITKDNKNTLKIQVPSYMYVEKYGKNVEQDIADIAKALGVEEWMIYYESIQLSDSGLLKDFMREIQKREKPGREFKGLVCIKFQDRISEIKELDEFLQFLSRYKERFMYVFSIHDVQEMDIIHEKLKQHFFIRVKEALPLTCSEIKDLLADFFNENQVMIEDEVMNQLVHSLSEKQWEESDQVKNLITGEISQYLFSHYLEKEKKLEKFERSDLDMCMHSLKKVAIKKKIGFSVEK